MKTVKLNFIFQIFLFWIFAFYLYGCSQSKNGVALSDDKKVPIIELNGTGYERGLQHGKQLKSEIKEVLEKWKANIVLTQKRDADSVIAEFLNATYFGPAIKRWTPDLLDELNGIADGSGQKFNDIFAFQLLDEFWVYVDSIDNSKKAHCSSIGVSKTKNHPAYIAQNVDLENYMNGYQIILHIAATKSEPEQYILSCAGYIASMGLNEKGIGLCMNALMELKASSKGLPVAFVIRGVLSKQNGEGALNFLKSVKHASGQNYIIGIQDSIYDFEASSNQVIRFFSNAAQTGIVYHTNHALVNHDVKSWYSDEHRKILAGETKNTNSTVRFDALEKRLNKPIEKISLKVIKATLRSKDDEEYPVCRTYEKGGDIFTFSSAIITLTGRPSIQLTYGSPDQSEYHEYFFKK